MNTEIELLQEIKNTFGWPVDTFRYGLSGKKRFLSGSEFHDELPERLKVKVRFSLQKVKIAEERLRILSRIPWVQMIFLTGSVASLNALEEDDIDVWLVVDPRRIWLTRAIDFVLYTISGRRRLSIDGVTAARVQDKFCFNFYSTTEALELSRHSISYAMQFVDSIPLFVRSTSIYKDLLIQNSWISKYFPSLYSKLIQEFKSTGSQLRPKEGFLERILDPIEYVAGLLMILKAEKKLTFSKDRIFCKRFTTWGTPRILSRYDKETISEGS